ncbi:hypothetical protein [Streptomyces kasugaensis]|nr:hypothetical protein [Streptomyces kasugaensis]
MLLEFGPFLGGDIAVVALEGKGSAVVQELRIVLDDVLGEDR